MSARNCLNAEKDLSFIPKYESIIDVLKDHELAALGDAFVNFIYSLALSKKLGRPIGRKVSSSELASAVKEAGLREFLPSRIDRHKQADAAEALIVYVWLLGRITFTEASNIIKQGETPKDSFSALLKVVMEKINLNRAVTI